ncbi:hypothetical protein [Burkholderia sp. IMCC1007]|uniref:hypothetical protein n=1 Tax=Burkholderia sp. IMCC1007 TaxID=3004104 RepID=UPI0022B32D59|nr:hypothetical protein [Burkholderia sp. IMCC1007]
MYIITDDQVQRLITMGDAIETMRFALAEQGRWHAKIQSRVRTLGENVSLSTMGQFCPLPACAVRRSTRRTTASSTS